MTPDVAKTFTSVIAGVLGYLKFRHKSFLSSVFEIFHFQLVLHCVAVFEFLLLTPVLKTPG